MPDPLSPLSVIYKQYCSIDMVMEYMKKDFATCSTTCLYSKQMALSAVQGDIVSSSHVIGLLLLPSVHERADINMVM